MENKGRIKRREKKNINEGSEVAERRLLNECNYRTMRRTFNPKRILNNERNKVFDEEN